MISHIIPVRSGTFIDASQLRDIGKSRESTFLHAYVTVICGVGLSFREGQLRTGSDTVLRLLVSVVSLRAHFHASPCSVI